MPTSTVGIYANKSFTLKSRQFLFGYYSNFLIMDVKNPPLPILRQLF